MTELYGDAGPEDAWHPDDPPAVLADNLYRRLLAVVSDTYRRGSLPPDVRERLELVADDLGTLHERLEDAARGK